MTNIATQAVDRTPSKVATTYVDAFVKNCPHVVLTGEDRMELWRLFHLALQAKLE
jgi:hypothetical protein